MAEARKIAAILVTDIVGFSRLAASDEDRTLARLRALRSDLIDLTISVYNGRVFKRTGDGTLIEFSSAVDVRCATEIQFAMIERNSGLPDGQRIALQRLAKPGGGQRDLAFAPNAENGFGRASIHSLKDW